LWKSWYNVIGLDEIYVCARDFSQHILFHASTLIKWSPSIYLSNSSASVQQVWGSQMEFSVDFVLIQGTLDGKIKLLHKLILLFLYIMFKSMEFILVFSIITQALFLWLLAEYWESISLKGNNIYPKYAVTCNLPYPYGKANSERKLTFSLMLNRCWFIFKTKKKKDWESFQMHSQHNFPKQFEDILRRVFHAWS
jgi:hypothetical protein